MDAIKEYMIAVDDGRVDLNFVTDGTIERVCAPRDRYEEVLRECFSHDLKLALNYAESAMDHCRDMRRAGYAFTDELAETKVMLGAFMVAVMAMQGEK